MMPREPSRSMPVWAVTLLVLLAYAVLRYAWARTHGA